LQAKPVEANSLGAVAPSSGTSVDDALALRQLHFLQPQPPQPYKAPPRPGFQSGIKQAYARAAAPTPAAPPSSPTPNGPEQASPAASAAGPGPADPAKTSGDPNSTGSTAPAAPLAEAPVPVIPEKPVVAQFAQTYTMLVKKAAPLGIRSQFPVMDGLAAMESAPPSGTPFPAPTPTPSPVAPASPALPPALLPTFAPVFRGPQATAPTPAPARQTTPAGTPQFDTTAPFMRRSAPDEPVTMEVAVTGEAPLHYQWETFDDLKGTATPIEGCNEPSLTVALEATDTMLAFQCRVSNGPCPQGMVSRTFFLKKAAPAAARPNSFGENLAQQPFAPNAPAPKRR
jgi:hypothetical protein